MAEKRDEEYDQIAKKFDAEQDREKIQKARKVVDIKTSKKFGSHIVAYILCFSSPFVAICCNVYFYYHPFNHHYIADDMFYESFIVSFYGSWWLLDSFLIVSGLNEFEPMLLIHHIIALIPLSYTFFYHQCSHGSIGFLVCAESAG